MFNTFQKLDVVRRQAESGVKVGEKEENSSFLTYLLSQTELSPAEVNSNCVDLMMSAVDTVPLSCAIYNFHLCHALEVTSEVL